MPCLQSSVHNPNNYQEGRVDIAELDDLTQRDMYLEMQKYPPSYQYKRNSESYNFIEDPIQTQGKSGIIRKWQLESISL